MSLLKETILLNNVLKEVRDFVCMLTCDKLNQIAAVSSISVPFF